MYIFQRSKQNTNADLNPKSTDMSTWDVVISTRRVNLNVTHIPIWWNRITQYVDNVTSEECQKVVADTARKGRF